MLMEKALSWTVLEVRNIRNDNPQLVGNWCGNYAFTQNGGVAAIFDTRTGYTNLVQVFQKWNGVWYHIGTLSSPMHFQGWGKHLDITTDYAGDGHELLAVTGLYKGELAMLTWRRRNTDVWDSSFRVSYF